MPSDNENEVPKFDMKKAMEEADREWKEQLAREAAEPSKKPPKKARKEPSLVELDEELKEKPPRPPKVAIRDLESILDVFKEFSDDEKHDRRIIFGESLQLAQRAEEDPKIEYDIRHYQSSIVNAALRMLTLDDVPEWVAEEGLKKLRMQVQRVFGPTNAPIQTGLRYKDPERMAKCLKVDLEKLLEEWTIIDRDSLAFIGITEEEIIRLPKPTKKKVPKKLPKPVKRAAKKPKKIAGLYDATLERLRKEYPVSEYKIVVIEEHMKRHLIPKLEKKLEKQSVLDETILIPGPHGSKIFVIPLKKAEEK